MSKQTIKFALAYDTVFCTTTLQQNFQDLFMTGFYWPFCYLAISEKAPRNGLKEGNGNEQQYCSSGSI